MKVKKILNIVLNLAIVFTMTVSCLQTQVQAATDPEITIPQGDTVINVAANASRGGYYITSNTTMIFEGNATITEYYGSGISVASNTRLTIFIKNNGTVNVTASGVRYAGIQLPATSTLVVKGKGILNAWGGRGTAPENGENGEKGSTGLGWSGEGGDGGDGGTAPGAGIGGNGGYGGSGGDGAPSDLLVYDGYQSKVGNGSGGYDGSAGGSCGTLMIFQHVQVNGYAGTNYVQTTNGGNGNGFTQEDKKKWGITGGAGGGGGGSAKGSAGIGGAGSGGGGGGGGGAGAWIFSRDDHHVTGSSGGSGGAGDGTSYGGRKSDQYRNGAAGNDGYQGGQEQGGASRYQSSDGSKFWAIGGSGGAGGNSPKSGDGGSIFCAATASYTSSNAVSTKMGFPSVKKTDSMVLLSDCDVTLSQTEYDYDGTAKTPTISITDKYTGTPIASQKGKNYSITYKKNVDAGTATVTIASAGSMTDPNYVYDEGAPRVIEYKINTIDNDITLDTGTTSECTYGNSFSAYIKDLNTFNNGEIVWGTVKDDTYTADAIIIPVAGTNNQQVNVVPTSVGKLRLKVTVKKKLNGSNSYNFTESVAYNTNVEVKQRAIDDLEITYPIIPEQSYTGALIKPKYNDVNYNTPAITFANNKDSAHVTLVEGVDYTLSYGVEDTNLNSQEGARAWVKITGINTYSGETIKYFHIAPTDISISPELTVTVPDVVFTGKEIRSIPVVSLGVNVLPTSDYEVIYSDAENNTVPDLINVGEKKVTIIGKGNLSGSVTATYTIKKADIANVDIKKIAPDVYFDGREILSKPSLSFYGIGLSEKDMELATERNPDDYTLSYVNNKEVGAATITISGINNFEGTRTMDFNVLKRPIYILPDTAQWKYYGQDELFGADQLAAHPTFTTFLKGLNSDATAETVDRINQAGSQDIAHINGYQATIDGNLNRTNKGLEDEVVGSYTFIMDSLQLIEDSSTTNINKNYELRLVDNESYYDIKPYTLDKEKANLIGILGKNDWYINERAKLVAPEGFVISASNSLGNENSWTDEITFADNDYTKDNAIYFLRNKKTKAVSDALKMNYKQDTKNPRGNIAVNTDAWNLFSTKIEYKLFLNNTATGAVYGSDETSQVCKKLYYLSDRVLTTDELDRIPEIPDGAKPLETSAQTAFRERIRDNQDENGWINETKFTMAIDDYNEKRLIIYAKVEDYAGNVTYISTDGIVFDKDAPTLDATYEQDGVWTTDDNVQITGTVYDANSGLKDRYVAYQIDNQAMQILQVEDDASFSIENLPDGDYTLTISAWDQADNKAQPKVFHVMKDTKMPRITVDGNKTQISNQQKINFTVDVGASKEAKLEVSYNNGDWVDLPGLSSTDYYAKENGTYSFRITNGAGILSETSSITFAKIDNKIPELSFWATNAEKKEILDSEFTNSAVTVMFVNNTPNLGNTKYEYSINNSPFVSVNANLDNEATIPVVDVEDIYEITARITAENGLSDTKKFTFTIDKTKPEGTIQIKDINSSGVIDFLMDIFRNKKQEISISTSDNASGVVSCDYYVVTGNGVKKAPTDEKAIEKMVKNNWKTGTSVKVDKNEQYIVYFKIVDGAGNISYVRSDRLVIDDEAPVIKIDYERLGLWDHAVALNVEVEDEIPGLDYVTYSVDGNIVDGSESFVIDNLTDGTHQIEIKAVDLSGNESLRKIEVKQDSTLPEIEAVEVPATFNGESVEISINAKHDGPSGLDKVLVQKNGKDFEDISAYCKPSGTYVANENGTYVFRAVSTSGAVKDTTLTINYFQAKEVLAKVIARKENGEGYQSASWTNQDVHLSFSNKIANLNGLEHYLKIDDGQWQKVTATNGYVEINAKESHSYEYKVGTVDGLLISEPLKYEVKIDRVKPNLKLTIGDEEWTNLDGFLNTITLGFFFGQTKPVSVIAEDGESGIDKSYYFIDKVENLPETFKGNTDASKVENYVKDGWIAGNADRLSPNSEYIVLAKSIDKAGNVSYVSSEGVVFDNQKPSISSSIIFDYWYTDDTTDLIFTVDDSQSGIKTVTKQINRVKNDVLSMVDNEFKISTGELQQGQNTITIEISDNSGNTHQESFKVLKDSQKPLITAEDITENKHLVVRKRQIQIVPTVGISDIAKVEVRRPDINSWENITSSYKSGFEAVENGLYWFRVTNNAGVSSDAFSLLLGDISQDVPELSVIANKLSGSTYIEDTWSGEDVIVQFISNKFTDDVEGYYYKIDSGAYQKAIYNKNIGAKFKAIEGEHIYTVKCILKNGLESETQSLTIKMDTNSPVIHINNENLTDWVKGTTLLEVEVDDQESGLNRYGLSFDAGETWQENNKINVYANKLVQVHAKDNVNNEAVEPVDIINIDSQGPTITEIQQENTIPSKTRNVSLKAADYKDIEGSEGSGVKEIAVMTSYPYKDGVYYPNPDVTFKLEKTDDYWITKEPVTVEKDGTNNIWIVSEDIVGNQKIYSTKLENMIKTENPDQPVDPDQPVAPDKPVDPDQPVVPDQPVAPDKPVNPDQPVNPDKPMNPNGPSDLNQSNGTDVSVDISNSTGSSSGGSTNSFTDEIQVSLGQTQGGALNTSNGEDKLTNIVDDKTLKDTEKLNEEVSQNTKNKGFSLIRVVNNYQIIWILLLITLLWLFYRFNKYRKIKKEWKKIMEQKGEDESEK